MNARRGPGLRMWAMIMWLVWIALPVSALETVPLTEDGEGRWPLGRRLVVLPDPGATLTIDDVLSMPPERFVPANADVPNFQFTSSAVWAHVRLQNPADTPGTWLLESADAMTQWLDVWLVAEGRVLESWHGGSLRPWKDRRVQARTQVYALTIPAKTTMDVHVRLKTDFTALLPLSVWTPAAFSVHAQKEAILHGLYVGVTLAMILYNLFAWGTLRERSYLFYVAAMASVFVTSLSLSGLLSQFVFPGAPGVVSMAFIVSLNATLCFVLLFSADFLQVTTPGLRRVFTLFQVVNLLSLLSYIVISPVFYGNLQSVVSMAVCFFCLGIGVVRIRQGDDAARYYVMGYGSFLAGSLVFLLILFGFIPANVITYNAMEIGSGVEAILLSLALAARMRQIKEEKDVAQRQALENQQLAIDQMFRMDRLKDEFLANTSHELRTPLNGIIGLAEAALAGSSRLPPEVVGMLDTIVASGRRLGSLVNDILDFSKLRNHDIALSLRAVDAKRMIDIVMALSGPLARDKPVLLRVEAADDLPLVLADENRLQQILHNLIGNAIKFTREGQVCIKASVLPSSLQISVADTGIGIPADRLDSIFDSFNQGDGSVSREFGGTGLGLSITRKLVELHGGSLLVESAPGKGSVFSLTLPLAGDDALLPSSPLALTDSLVEVSRDDDGRGAAPESAFVARESSVSNGSRPSQWVLVVDDEAVNRQVLRAQLGSAGFGVIEAPGGQEALDILGSPQAVDLVLLDVMMPRVSGYDVCRELRKTRPAHLLPVVFLTAKTQTRDILEGFAAGGNDYLLKPFSRDELLARLRIHLELLTTWRIISDYSRNLERRVDERTRELVMAQQALVSRQKASALGVLTAGVAHEINNPNNFVMAGLQNVDAWRLSFEAFVGELLDADADPEIRDLFAARFERLAEQLAVIQTGSQRINAIVAGLRVVTRLDEADQKPVDVVEGIENIIMLLAPSWAGQVIFSLDVKARPVITCWPGELNQVFMNIVLNACHAIAAGRKNHPDSPAGRVDIVAKYMPMDASHPGFGLSFRDDGEGMSPDVLARAFDPFFTTREVGAGAGLGLSIARDIVERHAGVIRADASPGKGCEVVVVLPLNSGE